MSQLGFTVEVVVSIRIGRGELKQCSGTLWSCPEAVTLSDWAVDGQPCRGEVLTIQGRVSSHLLTAITSHYRLSGW